MKLHVTTAAAAIAGLSAFACTGMIEGWSPPAPGDKADQGPDTPTVAPADVQRGTPRETPVGTADLRRGDADFSCAGNTTTSPPPPQRAPSAAAHWTAASKGLRTQQACCSSRAFHPREGRLPCGGACWGNRSRYGLRRHLDRLNHIDRRRVTLGPIARHPQRHPGRHGERSGRPGDCPSAPLRGGGRQRTHDSVDERRLLPWDCLHNTFRRPLTRDERTRYEQFFTASRAVRGFSDSARLFVQATLQSPSFLYRTELGARPTAKGPRSGTVDPYEAASALSYLFTGTLPDAERFAAAAAGRLSTASEIETQARRLLLSPRGLHVVRTFFEQWLDLDQVETIARDKTAYPEWTPALARAMRVEVMDFIEEIVWASDAKVATLLGSSSTFAGSALGGLYR